MSDTEEKKKYIIKYLFYLYIVRKISLYIHISSLTNCWFQRHFPPHDLIALYNEYNEVI